MVASFALGHGDTHEQIKQLDALLEKNPDHVASLLERADIHRTHRNYCDALDDLNRVRLLSPSNDTVHYLIGITLFHKGDLNEAKTALHIFNRRSPNSPRGYLALAKVHTQQRQYLKAAHAYELSIKNQSKPVPNDYLARAHAYVEAGKPYLAQALDGLEEAIDVIGPLITFQRLAIEIELAQGNHQEAITRIDGILRDMDRKETWLVKKARVFTSMGRDEEAREQYLLAKRAIELLPQRTKSSPSIRALQKTVHEYLNHKTQEKDVQYEHVTPP